MDYQRWKGVSFANVLEYNMVAAEMTEDLAVQLSAQGNKIHRSLPANYKFGAIAVSADGTKFVQITTNDLRDNSEWFDTVVLNEMTTGRELVDGATHICSWNNLGLEAEKYLV